jgi:hypothetical protein
MPYEHVYGVPLLDDLHNYFPALLYDHGRFLNLTHVFHYIRTQMSTRFNLYSYGASQFQNSQQSSPFPSSGVRGVPPNSFSFPTQHPTTSWFPSNPIPAASSFASQRDSDMPNISIRPLYSEPEENIATTNLLLSLLGIGSGIIPLPPIRRQTATNPWTPVLVRPSPEILSSNTQLLMGSAAPPNSSCSICQDSITPTDSCRKLTPCSHIYHRICIDQWFERSVHCPTCRHDIRVSPTPPNSSESSESSQQSSS